MVTNLAPVVAADITISAVPILPALILGWMLAGNIHRAIKDKVSVNDLLALLGWVILVPIILIAIAWFMLWDASQVYEVSPPPLGTTLARALVLHLTALVIGMGPRLWRALAKRYKVPRAVVDGVVLAALSLVALLAAAALVLLLALIVNWKNQALITDSYPHLAGFGFVAVIGLSILYLPNVLIAVGAILLGSEFHIGDASVSLFSVHLVPLPPLPVLGAVPGSAAPWAIALLLLTAIAIGFIGVKRRPNFLQAAVSGIAAGVIVLVFGYFVTGELGYYEAVGPMVLIAAGLAVIWVGGINLAVTAGFTIKARREAAMNQPAQPTQPVGAAEAEAAEAEAVDAEDTTGEAAVDAESAEGMATEEVHDEGAAASPTAILDEDYIDGEYEEAEEATETDAPAVGSRSQDLMDDEDDEDFPEAMPGEDDVADRLDDTQEAEDTEDIEVSENPEDSEDSEDAADVEIVDEQAPVNQAETAEASEQVSTDEDGSDLETDGGANTGNARDVANGESSDIDAQEHGGPDEADGEETNKDTQ